MAAQLSVIRVNDLNPWVYGVFVASLMDAIDNIALKFKEVVEDSGRLVTIFQLEA